MKPHIRMKNGAWSIRLGPTRGIVNWLSKDLEKCCDFVLERNRHLVSNKANAALAAQLRRNVE